MRRRVVAGCLLAVAVLTGTAPAADIHKLIFPGQHQDLAKARAMLKADPKLVAARDRDNRETPLHVAARYGPIDVVELLISMKADVNAAAYNQFTPLHLTTDKEIARLLVKAGADLDQRDAWGKTPLQMAAQDNRQGVADAILESGYPCDLISAMFLGKRELAIQIVRDDPGVFRRQPRTSGLWGGETPLAVAAGRGDLELVRLFLDAGAEVDGGTVMPNAGFREATALTNAVWGKHTAVVELLLRRGASVEGAAGGKFDDNILDYARKRSPPDILALLEHPPRGEPPADPATPPPAAGDAAEATPPPADAGGWWIAALGVVAVVVLVAAALVVHAARRRTSR